MCADRARRNAVKSDGDAGFSMSARGAEAEQFTAGRRHILVAALLLTGLVAGMLFLRAGREGGAERWFVPGPLGHEKGTVPPPISAAAYRTRALSQVEKRWARHNDLTAALSFSHNLGNIFPRELFDESPQFFPMVNGKRWRPPPGPMGWNPDLGRRDVAEFAADAARWQFTVAPDLDCFSIGVNDGVFFGESAETRSALGPPRWFRGRPDYSPLVFTFANRVAERLAATYPRRYLGALAYYWCENVPPFKVDPQVLPFLTADRSQGYDETFRREEFDLQDRWVRAGPRRLGLYDYLYGGGFLVPRITTRLLAENLRHARRAGFTDYYAEIYANWGLDGPMPWLTAQLLQDPERSPEVLLDEYYMRYFREAAAPMRQFYEVCERRWMTQPGSPYWLKHYRNESQAQLFPADVCRELRGDLDEAAARATTETTRARVQFVGKAFGLTERFVAMQDARVELARAALTRPHWREVIVQIRRFAEARLDFLAYVEWLRRESPLAIAPFSIDDYLIDDPVSGAMRAAVEMAASGREGDRAMAACAEIDPVLAEAVRASFDDTPATATWNPTFVPERRIADLVYGLSVPAGWVSRNEPNETLRAEWLRSPMPTLRLAGAKSVDVFRTIPVRPGEVQWARLQVRGMICAANVVSLRLGFMRADRTELSAPTDFRMPEGAWPDWRELTVVAVVPDDAAMITVELHVRNQIDGAWIEARGLELHGGAVRESAQTQ